MFISLFLNPSYCSHASGFCPNESTRLLFFFFSTLTICSARPHSGYSSLSRRHSSTHQTLISNQTPSTSSLFFPKPNLSHQATLPLHHHHHNPNKHNNAVQHAAPLLLPTSPPQTTHFTESATNTFSSKFRLRSLKRGGTSPLTSRINLKSWKRRSGK